MSRQTEDTMKPAGLESPPSSGTLASARKVVVPVPEPVAPDGPVVLPLIPDENLGLQIGRASCRERVYHPV